MVNILNIDPIEYCLQYRGGYQRHSSKREEPKPLVTIPTAELLQSDQFVAKGGFSKVFVRRHSSGELFAIQQCKCNTSTLAEIIKNEVDILKMLRHPNLMELVNYDFEKGIIVSRFYENGDLFQVFKDNFHPNRESVAQSLFLNIVQAVQALHQMGIYHRDLKIENVYLDSDYRPIIGDFGFAIKLEKDKQYAPRGTKSCWAPEMFNQNNKIFDFEKIDVFALAVMLFEMVYSNSPFENSNKNDQLFKWFWFEKPERYFEELLFQQNITVSQGFRNLFSQMVEVDPKKRITISQVVNHSYFQEDILNQDQIKLFFSDAKSKCQ